MTIQPSIKMQFPALLQAAEAVSAVQQRNFYLATGVQLAGLALASLASLVPADAAGGAGPMATLALLLIAIAVQLSSLATKSEQRWYDARAAAESIKSASWQFAVGGESFRIGDDKARARFTEMLQDVLKGLPALNIGLTTNASASVTPTMLELRESDGARRVAVYRHERVADQVAWYAKRADWNRHRSNFFWGAIVAVEAVAVVLGLVRVRGGLELDLLSAFVAAAAGLIGWTQAKKYASLAESYTVTSLEVGLVAEALVTDTEDAWAQSVHDAEAAFSREHTMWRARRQGPMK